MMRTFFCLFLLFFALSGCGVVDYYLVSAPEDTAQELFGNARGSMQDKDYPAAIDSLTKLNDRYPFSPYSSKARIMLGDAYFLNKQYFEAVDTYEEFAAMHPRDKNIDYIVFQVGLSKYRSQQAIDLPQTKIESAKEYFQRIIDHYPQSKYYQSSIQYIQKCRKLLAEHELYVADFYFSSGNYKAAWLRYNYVVDNFSDLKEVYTLAVARQKIAFYYFQEHQSDVSRNPSMFKNLFQWL